MPTAPFGDDLWLSPGIRSVLRKIKSKLRALMQKMSSPFTLRNAIAENRRWVPPDQS